MLVLDTLSKILNLLKEQKKTQKQLTDYLGVGKTVFTGWKSGVNNSYLKHIGKIAEFLNVSTDYLLGSDQPADQDASLRFALFGGDAEYISDDAFEEVRRFAKYVAEKEKEKKGE